MKPRIVFMGTPDFAVPCLDVCIQLGEVVAVVTQTDKPSGRGQATKPPPVKVRAVEAGLTVLQPPKIRGTDFAATLAQLQPDVAVVVAYGKILPQDVLDVPKHGCVNVHASLLPKYRGAAPIQWAVASGDLETGVCLMQMDVGMDTGPVIARQVEPIGPKDTSADLFARLSRVGAEVLHQNLLPYLEGKLPPKPQPTEGVVMAPMIKKEDGRADFARPAVELERRLRAFTPWPGLYAELNGKLLKVLEAEVVPGTGVPGRVLRSGGELVVATGVDAISLRVVQPEGKRAMAVRDFLAGNPIEVGASLA